MSARLAAALLVTATAATAAADEPGGFSAGSYGRVSAGTDLRGGSPEPVAVVLHGPRIVEDSYLQLDVYYRAPRAPLPWRVVATVAARDMLFHRTGAFDAALTLRNLYAETDLAACTTVWVGARMYRGDDIYLLDLWPLDDLNTVGGGVEHRRGALSLRAHAGFHRVDDPFFVQRVDVPDPAFGATTVEHLDRQRAIGSASATWTADRWKAKVHGELHLLGDGTRVRPEDQTVEELPSDSGWLLGAQLGTWGFGGDHGHANLFVRFGRGLAAFDELAVPDGLDAEGRVTGATELMLGWSSAYGHRHGGAVFGAYARRFVDADAAAVDHDDGWEYAADLRPFAVLARGVHAAVDLSYQRRLPRGPTETSQRVLQASVFQVAPMVVLSPAGDRPFDRPHLRLVYSAARRNHGALDLYPLDDPRREHTWVHFLGVQAEWWISSSYR